MLSLWNVLCPYRHSCNAPENAYWVETISMHPLWQIVCWMCHAQKASLVLNLIIHTGEKLYQWSNCDKCFFHGYGLVHHHEIYTGEKPYQCSQCDKCFLRLTSFSKTPVNTHWGDFLSILPLWDVLCPDGYSGNAPDNAHWVENISMHTLWQIFCEMCHV